MIIHSLKTLFTRDLKRLKKEIESYKNESNLWITDKDISNCGGNLALHLVGNLNTFIAGELGGSGYVRDRVAEFNKKDVPQAELIQMIDDTIDAVNKALDSVQEADLDKEYPILVFKEKTSTGYFLMHLTTHLSYHLGQVNYHRRLLD